MPDIFDSLGGSNSDIFDRVAPTSNRSRTDIFDQVEGSGDIFDRASPNPAGNLATDVAKGVSRGWEQGIGELGGFMSAQGDQMTQAFTGDTYKDETGKVWTRTPTQKKVAGAMVKLGSFFKNYGKEVQDFYRENANKGWEAPDPTIMFGWKHPIRKAVSLAAEGAPKMAVAGAVTAATRNPVAGAAVFAPGAYEQIYHEAIDKGKSPEEAAKMATLNAAAQVGLGVVPLGQWMRGANVAKRIIRTSLSAGIVQSGGGTAVTNAIRATGIEKPKTVEEFKNIMLDGMAESMVAGVLTGGVLGAFHPVSYADRISDHVDNWANKNLDKFAKENGVSKGEAGKIVEAAKNEIIKHAQDISKEISSDPLASMPEERPIPKAPITIPEFKNTEEALKFGWENKDNPAVLEALRKNREDLQTRFRELNAKENQTPAEEQEAFRLAQISQFPREALEAAAGKIDLKSKEKMMASLKGKEESLAAAEPKNLPPGVDMEKLAAGDKENFKLFEEVFNLKKEFAARVGERYVKPGSIGTYYPGEKSIRTRAMNDLFTTAHEMFHYISDTRKVMAQIYTPKEGSKVGHPIYDKEFHPIRKEIAQIYFDLYGAPSNSASMHVAMEEGGAMLIETYIKDPEFMTKKYPAAVKEFLTPGGKFYDPHVGEFVQKARSIYEQYLKQDPLGRILARVTNKEFATDRGSFLNLRDRLAETFFDSYYTAEKLGKEAGVAFTLKDPQIWFRLGSMMKHLAYGNMEQGRGYWTMNYKTGALEKVSERNWGDLINDLNKNGVLDKFSGWLIARDQYFEFLKLDQLRSDAQTAVSTEQRHQLIKDYQDQLMYLKRQNWNRKDIEAAYADYRDQFQKYGDEFNQYTRASLKMIAQAGLITPKQYAEMAVKESYAPMKRQIYDDILGPESDRVGAAIKVGGTKISSMLRRTGGMQTIVNPLYQAIVDMGEVYNKTMKQRSVNSVLNLASHFPDFFHRLQLTTLVDKETGRVVYPQEKDNNIMMMRVAGKRVPYLVDHDIKAFIENYMTPIQISVMEKMGNFTARLFTKGTTSLYPFFAFNNFIQDQVFALGNTRTKLVPVLDAAKLLHEGLLKKDPEVARLWERYNLLGGQYMTMMQNIRAMTPEDFFHFVTREKNAIEKVTEGVDKFMDIMAMPVQASELMTRFVEFAKAVRAGDPEIVALEKAGRVSGPFHHKGTWGGRGYRFLVDQIPYFNASMQILGEQAESWTSTDPVRRQRAQFVAMSVGALMIGSMVNAYRNGTEDQKRLLRDLNAQEQSKYLFMPDPNGKDLIRIRVPDMTGSAAGIINMILLGMMSDKSRYDAGDFANAATAFIPDQLNPLSGPRLLFSWLPQIIKPAVELATNTRTFPNLRPIESEGMSYREPKFRAYPTTSQLAKDLGKSLDLSPIKVDYLIQGYLGRVTKIPTWVYEQAKGGQAKFNFNPFIRRWYFESSQVLQDYYNKSREINQKYNTLKHKFETLSPQESRDIQKEHSQVLRINQLMDDYTKQTRETELMREDLISPSKQHWIETQRARILKEIEQLLDPSPVERGEE